MPAPALRRPPVRTSACYAAAFAPPLLSPERPVPAFLSGRSEAVVAGRYDIHRNNVTVSLINALAGIYPAVERITGSDFFRAMARFHVREIPPVSPLLFDYGRDFPNFVARYEYARTMPWLADVARIERAWLDAYHGAEAAPLPADLLGAVPHGKLAGLVFVSHPTTLLIRSRYPAVTIFSMNRSNGPVVPVDRIEPEDAMITRPDADVVVSHLPPGGYRFLSQLILGVPLGEAAAVTLEETPAFDLPEMIAGMIRVGAFTTIKHGDGL